MEYEHPERAADDPDPDCDRCGGDGIAHAQIGDDVIEVTCEYCDADPNCDRCGGTGRRVKMVMGRSGMVKCECRGGS